MPLAPPPLPEGVVFPLCAPRALRCPSPPVDANATPRFGPAPRVLHARTDFISILPFDLVTTTGLVEAGEGWSTSLLRAIRTVRLFRLIKLLRMLRASRIFARWQNYIGISYAQMGITKLLSVAIWTMHIMACAWAWQGAPLASVACEASSLRCSLLLAAALRGTRQ